MREISEQIEDIYGFEASAELVSRVTDKIIPQIEEWQNRTLSEIYPIVLCTNFVREDADYFQHAKRKDGTESGSICGIRRKQ
jgi:transposase-like protein